MKHDRLSDLESAVYQAIGRKVIADGGEGLKLAAENVPSNIPVPTTEAREAIATDGLARLAYALTKLGKAYSQLDGADEAVGTAAAEAALEAAGRLAVLKAARHSATLQAEKAAQRN